LWGVVVSREAVSQLTDARLRSGWRLTFTYRLIMPYRTPLCPLFN